MRPLFTSPQSLLKQSYRAKRADDEPRLDTIRQENVSITSQLIAYKETQTRLLKDIESLKAEKSTLVQRKVQSFSRLSQRIQTTEST